ncbi:hypothetical protein CC85DRAFT_254315 [Cutaneotrichosporon oleaginosum]|uniref:Telomere length regulation protein conserved domain-containing protein n=1 Tax=Cutaneotrichosporon oleaginosum TaxID=879819 RepID=A0A0J0XXX1_9TREE|nr:uncharacterized protein CC85DRAFT_254315 [Cutaneotrichosporon oleaginosum]KLT45890.1 hypothetical protein CC85DRAFT_254315 [Cutaneotrichosporon oleaginosum]TXT06591.1 hypothetical protein COLE_05922 [Cutaneotrichosporon oleaginosum]
MTDADALRDLRDALRAGVESLDDFVFRLSSALGELGISPSGISMSISQTDTKALRYLPAVQAALLSVLPTFLSALDARGRALLDAFFVPPPSPICNAVVLTSYMTLSSSLSASPPTPLPAESRAFVLETLTKLTTAYGIDALFWAARGELAWDDAVRAATSIPAKVANAIGRWRDAGWTIDVPPSLVPRAYFDALVVRVEKLAYEFALSGKDASPLRVLLEKLAALGLLSPPPEPSPSPSLLPPFLPGALAHLHPPPGALDAYPGTFFPSLLLPLPSSTVGALADALLAHLPYRLAPPPLEPDIADGRIRRAASVLHSFLGSADGEARTAVVHALLHGKLRSSLSDEEQHARRRMVVAWVGDAGLAAARALVDVAMGAWADLKGIKFGLFAPQFNLTHTLLLAVSLLPPLDPHLVALSHRAKFIQAVQAYLFHPDAKIRRLGMLVAEVVSDRTIIEDAEAGPNAEEEMEDLRAGLEVDEETGEPALKPPKPPRGAKKLKFSGIWDGTGQGQEECAWLRRCVGVRDGDAPLSDDPEAWLLGWTAQPDVQPASQEHSAPPKQERGRTSKSKAAPKAKPKIVMLDDDQAADQLEGYASSPASSRSPSPTPSFLEEVAADPSLAIDATKKRRLKRPVYVRQLTELLRDKDKPESIELALQWGEGLVRAKRGFGTEVADNAVAVAASALALADPYNLDDFESRRQGLVTALVACSPRNVPPFLAEQYFSTSYSLLQKSVMLTALAMGARELAGLPVPDAPRARAIDFASKTLPPGLHEKYITPADYTYAGQLENAVSGMRNLLLTKGAKKGEETVPELAREKRLRVTPKRQKVVGGSLIAGRGEPGHEHAGDQPPPVVAYSTVAAEYFVLPLINCFWNYYQDASVRETRALSTGSRFRGAGTGMALSPLSLEKLLATLALLVHAARHAPTFLAVLAPSAIELAVTIGARHPAAPKDIMSSEPQEGDDAPEAQVVGAALELALAALDTAVELDGGRTMALDHPELVLATGEWASAVFEAHSGGTIVAGVGSKGGRLRAAAAGVVVKVSEVGEKWGGVAMGR